MSGERKDIETDKRKYLVVGCGTGTLCTNHPHERWVSVDINPEVKPDVNKDLEELKPADFKDKKFQIVYVEGITNGINSQRAKILEPLMDSNYALISDQAYWVDDFLQGDVTNFLISYNYCIIVKGNSDLGETKEIIFNDLLNRQSPKEKEKIMKDIQLVWDDENPVKTGK